MASLLTPARARRLMLRATHLERPSFPAGRPGVRAALEALGCVQLDPIDRIGANPDLVLHARVPGYQRGDWASAMPTHAFEHFAKERCLLPARCFPRYRDQAARTPGWRLTERLKRLDDAALRAVLEEVRARGPLAPSELSDHGAVRPLDWNGWKGTGRVGTMALEVLAMRCQLVTVGRRPSGQRVYDLPGRALPDHASAPAEGFFRAGVLDRVRSAGLLSTASGPWWSMLGAARKGRVVADLLAEGRLVEVGLPGTRRRWYALPAALEASAPALDADDALRILGPLDPLLWDRQLVERAFGFTYIWEVYKPAARRRWGYYVCPLLHRGELVGRIEARRSEAGIEVLQQWGTPEPRALDEALGRLEAMQPRRASAAPEPTAG